MSEIEFYFDYSCPWTYLAFTRLKETATRTGSKIVWHPILLDFVFGEINPTLRRDRREPDPRRARYQAKDLADWARYCGLTIRLPKNWPARAELAARGAIIAERTGQTSQYSEKIFRAYFDEGRDISEPAIVAEIAALAGLDRAAFEFELETPGLVEQVRANSLRLIERGGFGSPTLFVGEQMFFGSDRMPLVEFALGQASERRFVMPGQHG